MARREVDDNATLEDLATMLDSLRNRHYTLTAQIRAVMLSELTPKQKLNSIMNLLDSLPPGTK